MIAVIDVCGTNLSSLGNALKRLGVNFEMTHSPAIIQKARHVILPGVASAPFAMEALRQHQLVEVLQNLNQPLLGICLGMQLLFEFSEEGNTECLGLMPGVVRKLKPMPGCPVPHMGWNNLLWKKQSFLQTDIRDYFVYFVHSYAVLHHENAVATCNYQQEFTAVVQQGNIYGMQFHPEKSAAVGLQLLKNFLLQEIT